MDHSLYVHIPFCTDRCAYCDFNTYAGQQASIPAYVEALCTEIEWVAGMAPRGLRLHTIYFGGGTPSLLTPGQFASILGAMLRSFQVARDAEITMEANPGTVSGEDLRALRALGINRISLGVQSANGEELRMLERTHTYLDVLQAVSAARRAGFDNLNLDLIYGLPEQTLPTWQSTVKRILALGPDHVSAYALTLEHGTPFGSWSRRGLMATPNPDEAADMYEWLSEELQGAGYAQYEISNWSRDGRACRHNLQYWRGLPYLGAGAGAHGYANGYRYSNVLRIQTYLDRMKEPLGTPSSSEADANIFPLSPAVVDQHRQSIDDDMAEFMIMGLRLTREGIAAADFDRRFGVSLDERFGKVIDELRGLGLLEEGEQTDSSMSYNPARRDPIPNTLRLTKRGRLLGNQVFVRFVD
jgi:oxygen-independent coproporphyrinogen-3 oxidase